MDYVGVSGKEMNTSMIFRTIRRSNNKKKSRTDITDIVSQDFIKFFEEFTDLPTSVTGRNKLKVNPQNIISSYYLICLIKVNTLYYVMKQLSIIFSTRNTSTK